MKDAAKLLRGLVRLSDKEGCDGFRVVLDYDNTHDGARVLDADGRVLGECYDDKEPDEQFIEAIRRAVTSPNTPVTGDGAQPRRSV